MTLLFTLRQSWVVSLMLVSLPLEVLLPPPLEFQYLHTDPVVLAPCPPSQVVGYIICATQTFLRVYPILILLL